MDCSFRITIAASLMCAALLSIPGDAQQSRPQPQPATDNGPSPAQAPPPQQPAGGQPPPTFRTGINFVRVDVIVSDKQGEAVSDLKQVDFEVTEDGKPQSIEAFKLVKLDGGIIPTSDGPPRPIRTDSDEELEASRDDVRLFAVFLDDYHVRRLTSLSIRDTLARFVQTQLGPSDMIGLMYPLESVTAVRMTRDHEAIEKGLQEFVGRKFEYEPKNQFEERYAHYPANSVEQIRNQVSMSALKALITHMGSLKEGRKALILVSEGYSNILPPQLRNPVATAPGFGNPAALNPFAGTNDPNEDRAMAFSNFDTQSELRWIYDTANHNNVAIYPVDPRRLATSEFDITENVGPQLDQQYLSATMDTLRVLAEQTDGRAIVNRNDLAGAMKQIVRDSSAYYLLGYTSSKTTSDGKFHEIKVRVKRSGVQVRARKGYWAMSTEEVARATAPPKPGPPKAVETALAGVSQTVQARLIRTWIGSSRGENGKTRVTFVWEPVPKSPGDVGHREEPARVALMAVGNDGTRYFRGSVPDVMLASTAPAPSAAGGGPSGPGRSRVTFEVPPGKIELRVSVEGEGAEVLDSEIRQVSVPDLTSPQTLLGTAEVFRAHNLREFQQLKSDRDAVPTVAREFSRADRLLVRIPAYGPGGTVPVVTARLLNRAGQPLSDLPVAPPPPAGGDLQIDLPLASLAASEYVIEFAAKGEGGDVKELMAFRVTN